jgi:hypothetical protein
MNFKTFFSNLKHTAVINKGSSSVNLHLLNFVTRTPWKMLFKVEKYLIVYMGRMFSVELFLTSVN